MRPIISPPPPSGTIGVVFVRGIGSQPQSSTVRQFAGPLLEYIKEWHRTRGHPEWELDSSELSYGGSLQGPARVTLGWPSYRDGERSWPERRFIFAEAWWEARLSPPAFDVMVLWSFRTLWGVVAQIWSQIFQRVGYLTRRRSAQPSDPGPLAAIGEVLSAVVYIVAYVIVAILGYLVLIPLFLAAYIPIDALQEFVLVKALKPFLVDLVGEHEVYMYDEVQALNARAVIGDVVRDLAARGCDRVVVVAHSEGAIVAFDALCALGVADPASAARVRKLVTLGGALNRAFAAVDRPPRLLRTLPAHIFWLDIWSFYDPVAGGYLRRRRGPAPLVSPSPELRARMHWKDGHDGPLPDLVTNSMNPLVDHGGYLRNPEQFVNRVLAEIDDPDGYYQGSRFTFARDFERVRRRRTRISALAWWRLIAIVGFVGAVVLRGAARLAADGHQVARQAASVPGHELLTSPGILFEGAGAVLDRLAGAAAVRGTLGGTLEALRGWWAAIAWSDLVTGIFLVAAIFAALYFIVLWAVYRPWDEREAREAVAPSLPSARWRPLAIALRAIAVLVVFGIAVIGVAGA